MKNRKVSKNKKKATSWLIACRPSLVTRCLSLTSLYRPSLHSGLGDFERSKESYLSFLTQPTPRNPRPTTHDLRPATCKGLTVLELLVVVIIMALMTGIAVTRFTGSRSRTSVKLTARSVASVMRLAQSRAAAEQHPYSALYDRNPDSNERYHSWIQKGPWVANTTTKDPVFGTEKVLLKKVIIDSSTTGGAGIEDPDANVFYFNFSKRGGITPSGKIRLRDTESKIKYQVSFYGTGVVHIESDWRD